MCVGEMGIGRGGEVRDGDVGREVIVRRWGDGDGTLQWRRWGYNLGDGDGGGKSMVMWLCGCVDADNDDSDVITLITRRVFFDLISLKQK